MGRRPTIENGKIIKEQLTTNKRLKHHPGEGLTVQEVLDFYNCPTPPPAAWERRISCMCRLRIEACFILMRIQYNRESDLKWQSYVLGGKRFFCLISIYFSVWQE